MIMLSVRALDEFSDAARVTYNEKYKCQIGVLLGSLESTELGDSNGTSRKANGQVKGTQAHHVLAPRQAHGVKAAKVPIWHNAVRKSNGNPEGKWEMGQESV
jgi:hypothetical protein